VHTTPVHKYEYGAVPPDGFAVNVIDCPTSIEEVDGEIVPAERIMVLTVTVMVAVFDTGEYAESFTCTVAVDVVAGDVVQVCDV